MSQFLQSAPTPVGAPKPIQPGGVLSYRTNTKPSSYANQNVQPTYGFKTYNTPPPCLGPRSGHWTAVVQQPDDMRMGAPLPEDIFSRGDPEMDELTDYFLNTLPTEQKSIAAVQTIKTQGLQELLTNFLRKKLQDDAEEVKVRYAGATAVESSLASARLQNRFSDMIRYYGSEQRLREALLKEVVGGEPDVAVRAAVSASLRREMAEGGAGAFPVDADGPPDSMPAMGGEVEADGADAGEFLRDAEDETEGDIRGDDKYGAVEPLDARADPAYEGGTYMGPDSLAGETGYEAGTADAPGLADSGAYEAEPMIGGGSRVGPAFPQRGAPAGTTGRSLIGEIIGQQAPSAPAFAMASSDPAGAGASARQGRMLDLTGDDDAAEIATIFPSMKPRNRVAISAASQQRGETGPARIGRRRTRSRIMGNDFTMTGLDNAQLEAGRARAMAEADIGTGRRGAVKGGRKTGKGKGKRR